MNLLKNLTTKFSLLQGTVMTNRNMSSFKVFSEILENAKKIVALTGAGVSAESGIGTFKETGGYWRQRPAIDLASASTFLGNPALVWDFYNWKRKIAFGANPNNAHLALAKYEQKCKEEGRSFTVLTQNIDGLHTKAGSENVIELHGSLEKVICTKCKLVEVNYDSPICEAIGKRSDPCFSVAQISAIPISELPKCSRCNALIRPYITWFGESLDINILRKTRELVESCDLFLVVGTSSMVFPAASFALFVIERGKPIAEFNVLEYPASNKFQFYFRGRCGVTLPAALGITL